MPLMSPKVSVWKEIRNTRGRKGTLQEAERIGKAEIAMEGGERG